MKNVLFRKMLEEDYPSVKKIYLEGIATGNATFQTDAPNWKDWDFSHLKHSRIIAEINGEIAGWAALSAVSGRCVYAGVAEVSVYINSKFRGKNLGTKILEKLIESSEENGIWTLTAGIFPENVSSVKIHEKNGFRIQGFREKIGKMNGVWRDTLLLEKRSKIIGIN